MVQGSPAVSHRPLGHAATDHRRQTSWVRRGPTSVRTVLLTKSAGAWLLIAAIASALVWANAAPTAYRTVWSTQLSLRLGSEGVTLTLQDWINQGLMTLFFLLVGLEARREFDLGELRERRRFLLPLGAGLLAMAVPVLIYLSLNHGGPGAAGWGAAMSTDTALALGLLTLVGAVVPDRARLFLVTAFVVDDLVALLVVATCYSGPLDVVALAIAAAAFGVYVLAQRAHRANAVVSALTGVVSWLALLDSGVDPLVAGLGIGLTASAYTPPRNQLEGATALFRTFREEPTPQLARNASLGLNAVLSPNARLQRAYLPWTTYVIVPLFGLANAGVKLDSHLLRHAATSPITLGIVVAYVVGKPTGVVLAGWAIPRLTHNRVERPVGWLALIGSGAIAGSTFTVSLLIADIAFDGHELAEAKVGILVSTAISLGAAAAIFHSSRLLPIDRRTRALLGRAQPLLDLAEPFQPDRDHHRGRADASVILLEYGDFECPHCGLAEPAARAELKSDDDLLFVWRHLPLTDVHPHAQLAAEAAEAAGRQDAFWPLHDLLLARQRHLTRDDLIGYARELGLDVQRFTDDLDGHVHAARIAADLDSADRSNVSGTPTFFVNGRRHHGAYEEVALRHAVNAARLRARSGGQTN